MVKAGMKGLEGIEGEGRDHIRIAAGLIAIGRIREECVHDVALENRIRA